MKRVAARRAQHPLCIALALVTLGLPPSGFAADPGRLFYTPEQRAQLEAARARKLPPPRQHASPTVAAPAVRFDGVVVRSDGSGTTWVNGRARAGGATVQGLKPGQIRADGRVYEPYQLLRRDAGEAPTP